MSPGPAPALNSHILKVAESEAAAAKNFLCRLLAFPSLPGEEADAMQFVEESFRELGLSAERIPFPEGFVNDTEYSSPIQGLEYEGRWNLEVMSGRSVLPATIFNTHVDVVPASKGQMDPFKPIESSDGIIRARGACDAKGQVAVLYLLARIMKLLEAEQKRRMILHLVVEEENGGNGTLGMIRANAHGDEAVVLEPSRLRLLTAVRGAVWFRLITKGRASHSGQAAKGISALNLAIEAKSILERYHAALLKESVFDERFAEFPNPMPLTFGRLVSGEWPAMTPDEATLEGVMGFLPNRTREMVIQEMCDALIREASPELVANHELGFMYKHDCHVIAQDAPLVLRFESAMASAGLEPIQGAMPASCDSWYYSNLMGVPTVVFGAGDLAVAHTADEHINYAQVVDAAKVLAHLLCTA